MKRVAIVGSGGSGKSTLARRMGEITGLPVIHLDAEHWRPGWQEPPKDEWSARVAELVRAERWIMDGNYGGTMPERFAAADTIVFLDLPRSVCLWRAVLRRFRYRDRRRPDMAAGCNEQLDWGFIKWIWSFPGSERPRVLAMLRDARESGKQVSRLRSRRAVAGYLRMIKGRAADADAATA